MFKTNKIHVIWKQRDLSMLSPQEHNFNSIIIESTYVKYLGVKLTNEFYNI